MNKKTFPYLVIFLGLFTYLVLRGIHVQMLHDSIATFFRYVFINKFLPYHSEWSANNHYLNSLLMWISFKLFGSSALALKLPNILTFPIYVFFVYKIAGSIKNQYLHWGFFICMLFAHNYFEFFGTGRGYGMSMAFLTGGIWFTMQAAQSQKTKHFILAFTFLILASYANLTIMNSFIVLTGILGISIILNIGKQKTSNQFKNFASILIFALVPIFLLIKLLFALQDKGELYYGEPEGFFQVSVKSLSRLLTGFESTIFPYFALAFFIFIVIIYFYIAFRNKEIKNIINRIADPKWVFFFLLTGNIIAYFLEQKLFGIDYPEDRTGLFFYPFFIGTIFFGLAQIKFNKSWYSLLPVLPFLFFPIHFIANANLSWSSLENHAIPERFFNTIAEDYEPGHYPPTLEGYHTRTMRWNYMNLRNKPELSIVSFESYPSMDADYQIVWPEENPTWSKYYNSIDTETNSKLQLLKRKKELARKLCLKKSNISSDKNTTNEYFELYRGNIDSLSGNSLYVGFELNLKTFESPFHGWIVTSIADKDNNNLRYEYIPLYWFRSEWRDNGNPFINGLLIHSLPEEASTIVTYIWNIGGKPFTVKNSTFEIFKLDRDY